MKKKDKLKRGGGVVVSVLLNGSALERVSKMQADYLVKTNCHLSRQRAVLKILSGE